MTDHDDLALLEAARGGDDAALWRIVVRHLDWLRTLVRRRLAPELRRDFDSGDMLHEVVLGVLRGTAIRTANDSDHFKAILARTVEKDVIDRIRWSRSAKRDRSRERNWQGDSALSAAPLESVTRPSQHFERTERATWIRMALERMGAEDRAVLNLRIWKTLDYREIGDQLKITEDTARMRVRRALHRLAKVLESLRDSH